MTSHHQLVLASSSPRRQQLLTEAGFFFVVDIPEIDEVGPETHPELSAYEVARTNAGHKAQVVSVRHPNALVLGADTVVSCSGRILGKPNSLEGAKEMLRWLSGRTHEVLTAVACILRSKKECHEQVVRTWVTFRTLTDEDIADYLMLVHVLDKAGAYAAQEHGERVIERIEGSHSNVVGLPMEIIHQWWGKGLSS